MATLFKTHFTNYDETLLNNAKDLNIRVSDIVYVTRLGMKD